MRPQELNLLIVFDAIMTEGSISRAADRLSMTQPAVSNAVSRMRIAWKDELFVKDGRNIKPTLKAENMWTQIKQPISELSDVISPNEFDPAISKRTFRISAADIVAQMLMVPLRKVIEKEAKNINIHLIPYTIINTEEVLEGAKVDLVIGAGNVFHNSIRSEHLFQPIYVCAMRPDHPLANTEMTLEKFAVADHLLVSLSGDVTGVTDEALAQKGITRRIAISVNQFSLIPTLLINSDLICVAPLGVISEHIANGTITATRPPFEIPPFNASMCWHKRQDRDPGLLWLRNHSKRIIMQAEHEYKAKAIPKMCDGDNSFCN